MKLNRKTVTDPELLKELELYKKENEALRASNERAKKVEDKLMEWLALNSKLLLAYREVEERMHEIGNYSTQLALQQETEWDEVFGDDPKRNKKSVIEEGMKIIQDENISPQELGINPEDMPQLMDLLKNFIEDPEAKNFEDTVKKHFPKSNDGGGYL